MIFFYNLIASFYFFILAKHSKEEEYQIELNFGVVQKRENLTKKKFLFSKLKFTLIENLRSNN